MGERRPALFAAAVAVSAALLFVIQPLFAKLLLPRLGGAPAVWIVCATFYQLAVLVGYVYAHLLSRLPPGRQAVIHLALLTAGLLFLPPTLQSTVPPHEPITWLLARLAVGVGPLVVLLSATAPLLTSWFGRPSSVDPAFLYATSNAGSLVGLLAYPLAIEPLLSLGGQRLGWSVAYGLFVLVAAACAFGVRRAPPAPLPPSAPPTVAHRLRWLLLAFVPSSLYLGFTTWVTTDLAAVPLLWVLPLTVYLGSFIAAFARRPFPARRILLLRLQPLALFAIAIEAYVSRGDVRGWTLVAHFVVLVLSCFVCHRELAEARPAADRLTEYYVWVAVGGVLGGLFVGVLAPRLFQSPAEYPLALVLTALCRPATNGGRRWLDVVLPLLAMVFLLELARRVSAPAALALAGVLVALPFVMAPRFRLTAGVAAMMIAAALHARGHRQTLFADRTFFGVHRVRQEGDLHLLLHGDTWHGLQSWTRKREPLGYHSRSSPVGELLSAEGLQQVAHVGIVGLGAGALAAYGHTGQRFTFFELDPLVETIARDQSLFTYLRDCAADVRVVLGDARLSLESAKAKYDLIVLDAFSSDSVPVHLMTTQAVDLYLSRLTPGGLLVFNVSNRYVRLAPVLAAVARALGASAWMASDLEVPTAEQKAGKLPSEWLVVARSWNPSARWTPLTSDVRAWTDQFSNLAGALGLR